MEEPIIVDIVYVRCAIYPHIERRVDGHCRHWAESLVRLYFPGIASRYQRCINWHKLHSKTEAMFGLFFQLCINGIFLGQKRVHCSPHTDSKNVIGVCLLIVYEIPGMW